MELLTLAALLFLQHVFPPRALLIIQNVDILEFQLSYGNECALLRLFFDLNSLESSFSLGGEASTIH